jgi:glutathione-independent formaldehyde dehydrogenase
LSPVKQVLELTGGQGADCGCECVGYQARPPEGYQHFDARSNGWTKVVLAPAA